MLKANRKNIEQLKQQLPKKYYEFKSKHETKSHNSKLIVEGISKSPLAEFINKPHHDMSFKEYQELSKHADEKINEMRNIYNLIEICGA